MQQKKKHRSPGYPGVGLRAAIEHVRNLYLKDGIAGAPLEFAAQHIGFRTPYGQALSAVAAIKKFALGYVVGDRLVPSERAVEIISLKEEDPRRIEALQKSALHPPIYRELVERYRDSGLPPDTVLHDELVERGFNPGATRVFIRDFKDTLKFAGIMSNGALQLKAELQSMPGREEMHAQTMSREELLGVLQNMRDGSTVSRRYALDISIARKLKAELVITGEGLRRDDLEPLKKQLERLLENLADGLEH